MPEKDVVITAVFEPFSPAGGLTVTSLQITDILDNEINELVPLLPVKVTARIHNSTGAAAGAIMVISLYDDSGKLLDVQLAGNANIPDGQYGSIVTAYQMPQNIAGKKMTIMVWNSMDRMSPLTREFLFYTNSD